MIRIYKDNDTKVVTKGAYDTFYKPLGYNIVLESVQEEVVEKEEKTIQQNDDTVTKPKKANLNKKNKKED
jgi:hypothetical protein